MAAPATDAAALAKANEPVPDMVKQFVVYFYRHIREKNGASLAADRRFAAAPKRGGWGRFPQPPPSPAVFPRTVGAGRAVVFGWNHSPRGRTHL